MKYALIFGSVLIAMGIAGCSTKDTSTAAADSAKADTRIPVIIDSDANNELDDQHALAYAFSNQDVFNILGVTVNNTRGGNGIQGQYDEAMRVMRLFNEEDRIPLLKGATGSYTEIEPKTGDASYDGNEAVDFIVSKAREKREGKLVLLPVGKLTNIALALKVAPDIKDRVRVVWLGSNYPSPGEYNLENDTTSINPVLRSGVEFEIVVVRYGDSTGTHAVSVTPQTINEKMLGVGPKAKAPVTGRHGGEFTTFGDYSIDLFKHIELDGDPPSRALYDMVAVAIVKNPSWGKKTMTSVPPLKGYGWNTESASRYEVVVWENFDKGKILEDFFRTLRGEN